MADIPDGLYETGRRVVREGMRVLRSLSLDEASALAEILRQRQRGEANDEAVVAAAPEEAKSWIAAVLRNQWTPFFLAVLLSLVLYFKQDASAARSEEEMTRSEQQTQAQIHRVEEQNTELHFLVRQMINEMQSPQKAQVAIAKGLGRNERCWCGSGKKLKYCHGKTLGL